MLPRVGVCVLYASFITMNPPAFPGPFNRRIWDDATSIRYVPAGKVRLSAWKAKGIVAWPQAVLLCAEADCVVERAPIVSAPATRLEPRMEVSRWVFMTRSPLWMAVLITAFTS